MAIVFDSDAGTITGLSVGGLPDGIVDSGTLATNSVDSAELIDGAIDNSHIDAMAASKLTGALPAISGASLTGLPAPTTAQMPAGSVLQVVRSSTITATASTSSSWIDITNLNISITPSSTSSKVLVIAYVKGLNPSSSYLTGITLRLLDYNSTGELDFDENHGINIGDDGALNSVSVLTGLSSPSSTSEVTYKVQGRNRQVATWTINGSTNTRSTMVAMEIAG